MWLHINGNYVQSYHNKIIHAKILSNSYKHFKSAAEQKVILSGWKAIGIPSAVSLAMTNGVHADLLNQLAVIDLND